MASSSQESVKLELECDISDDEFLENVDFHLVESLGKKNKICVFPVTRPTLIFPSDPKVFIGIPKK